MPKSYKRDMPLYRPNILFSDGFGSAGDTTWYHRHGRCYTRKRCKPVFPGTAGQQAHMSVHQRAMAAWRTIPGATQLLWNDLAEEVEPHRPPFDHKAYISGNNLFVSAYHGFVTLGNEHVPEPQAFVKFPPYALEFVSGAVDGDDLRLTFRCFVCGVDHPERYRVLNRLHLTSPGGCINPGKMRNFLALQDCPSPGGVIDFIIPDYKNFSHLDLHRYQINGRHRLLDNVTGYRNQLIQESFQFDLL